MPLLGSKREAKEGKKAKPQDKTKHSQRHTQMKDAGVASPVCWRT